MSASGLLAGRAAIITGGARGLGAAVAKAFAREGARVAILDLPEALGAAGAHHGDLALSCNVADEAQTSAAIGEAAQRFGRIAVAVANAGVVPPWRGVADLDM
ncbi:MAG: SDR family NAD(P)-dependent oxidoreductase, partial [Beijerinckiaceae bacterium]